MFSNIVLQVVSFMYIAILSIIYFTKRNYNFIQSKVYKIMLVMTMITIVFDSASIMMDGKIRILIFFYRSCLYIWLVSFISYIFLSCIGKKYESFKDYFKERYLGYFWFGSVSALYLFLAIVRVKNSLRIVYILD